ncbi:MAG TPA: cob(I)yrinic acid a,c-diamide adenosyltransferase [Candidatus Paceibacterota bacterium]|nr:cob(I)yrinic acid a,c-diamide adenosyltransferase [Candidatus Paceibacterota bacterium]
MLYTGKGDGGTTKTFDAQPGVRISKASELPEALGTLDELNSFVGLAKVIAASGTDPKVPTSASATRTRSTSSVLADVQETLFIVQAEIAGAPKKVGKAKVTQVEVIINTIEQQMPPITTFTVAGGTELSATLDVARTLARRAERRVVGVEELGLRKVSPSTKAYLNRLSSLLFALARFANESAGIARQAPKYK